MTDAMSDDERLAAEYVFGLLDGEDLLSARARLAREPGFAALVARWEDHAAPLLDAGEGHVPDEDVLARVHAQIAGAGDGAQVIALRRSVTRWRCASGAAAAAAIVMAVLVAEPADRAAPAPERDAAPLVANVPIGDTDLRLSVTYLPDRGEMLVSASGLTADGVHDHELWLVPDEGALQSLGVVAPGTERRMPISPEIAERITARAGLVLTREPLGGKPVGEAAGPVVAEGRFTET
ncbi:anti-sigma factor [Alteriqipengyuania sp. WL0013]|uniref:anti-sigma factor n=1 Tax=Alteriqipengyuania sp. WL0013 TaxID=3110773 RepID=UPI002C6434A9|nr:anti-sigma factor [Alteriqipengyuania sp. WL0013]MEB3415921.1 anti-sigma factor [Alteriqipengyuania sp. WL0013]